MNNQDISHQGLGEKVCQLTIVSQEGQESRLCVIKVVSTNACLSIGITSERFERQVSFNLVQYRLISFNISTVTLRYTGTRIYYFYYGSAYYEKEGWDGVYGTSGTAKEIVVSASIRGIGEPEPTPPPSKPLEIELPDPFCPVPRHQHTARAMVRYCKGKVDTQGEVDRVRYS